MKNGLALSLLMARLCNRVSMKNKNMRELEKRWATEAAKKRKQAGKNSEKKTPDKAEEIKEAAPERSSK